MVDETRELARFVSEFKYENIPDHVRALTLDNLIDQLGCEISSSQLIWGRQVRDAYGSAGGTPEATVVGYGDRLPVVAAAFINSTFGHSFEYDDVNPPYLGHPGAELIPAFMAIAEREHKSGRDFLTTFVAAYELRGRIGWSVSPDLVEHGGPHPSSTCGPFGAAAGVARLLGLGTEGIRNAVAIAGSFSGGLMQYDHGGGSVKRIVCAIAASNGMQAARLAQVGMTGPEGILEGKRGLLRIFSSNFRTERLVADFGRLWTIERVLFKPYCCCAVIHPAIDGLTTLVARHKLKPDDIKAIEIGYPTRSYDHAAITSPHDLLGMQFSTSYSLALTVLKGGNTPREYTEQALTDPCIKAFASRVRLVEEPELGKLHEGRFPARVKVETASGTVHEELVINAKGSPGACFTSDEIDAKFRSQVSVVMGAERCEKLIKVLRSIDTLDDMAKLPPMLTLNAA